MASSLLDGNAWFGGNLFYRRDPGHIANRPTTSARRSASRLGF